MKSIFKPLLVAGLLAAVGLGALAQGQDGAMREGAMMHHGRMDPAKMQEAMAKHQAELKAKLGLSAAQEAAWSNYVAAMQPPPDMAARMNPENRKAMRDAMEKLSTPERIDKMAAMKAERDVEMARRAAAVKNFYSALTATQQKIYDDNAMRHGPGHRHGGGPGKPAQNA